MISHASHQELLIESQVTWVAPTFDSTKVRGCVTNLNRDFEMGSNRQEWDMKDQVRTEGM
jgi:hypothetical protein